MNNNKKIEFGIFILTIGVVLLLANIGIINWSIIDGVFDLWPAIFIVIGVNIIFRNNSIVRIITWILFLAAIILYGYFFNGGIGFGQKLVNNRVVIEKKVDTERGNLKLGLGGTRLDIASTGENLVEAGISDRNVKYNTTYRDGDKKAYIEFEKEGITILGFNGRSNESNFKLNRDVIWDLDIDTGAVNGTVDMSDLKVDSLDLDVGAANVKLIFSDRFESTDVDIDAGATSVDVIIPASAGVKVKMDGGLNNTNLDNLNWARKGDYYMSSNYNEAKSKINMDVDMGVGKLMFSIR